MVGFLGFSCSEPEAGQQWSLCVSSNYDSVKWFLMCGQWMGTAVVAGWQLKGEFYLLVLSKCFESSSITACCLVQWDVHHDCDCCVPVKLPGKGVTVNAMGVGWKSLCSSLNAAMYLKKKQCYGKLCCWEWCSPLTSGGISALCPPTALAILMLGSKLSIPSSYLAAFWMLICVFNIPCGCTCAGSMFTVIN